MKTKNRNKWIAFTVASLFVVTGTYNAVVINSDSHLSTSDMKFVKRLDEIYGVRVEGRRLAAATSWQKLAPTKIPEQKVIVQNTVLAPETSSVPTAATDVIPAAAVQEELSLNLVEVINPKKWQNGLPATQFQGSLSTNNGVIEELAVSLPNGEGVSVAFTEMSGNVFEYDLNGELYSGMMYQVDQYAYMVTLTNGPLEGTRLRFTSEAPSDIQQNTQEVLAENNNIEVGNFGNDGSYEQLAQQAQVEQQAQQDPGVSPEAMVQNDQQMQMEAAQAQGYNFNQQEAM